jgi:kumamolisin
MAEQMVALPGSEIPGGINAQAKFGAHVDERMEVTVWLKNPNDNLSIRDYARSLGLDTVEAEMGSGYVILSGKTSELNRAFGVKLLYCEEGDRSFKAHAGPVMLPARVANSVLAVLGLYTRDISKPHFRELGIARPAAGGGYYATQIAQAYNFPPYTGKGVTVAILQLGGGYRPSDFQSYFKTLLLKQPAIRAVGVDGGQNRPGAAADTEVALDVEVCGAVAPDANYIVVFAPNTDRGFVDALNWCVNNANVVSISWGGPEKSWPQQSVAAMNRITQIASTKNVPIFVASGDNGSDDGVGDGQVHVDYPASDPFVVGCGGTRLAAGGDEVVWMDSQGGATGGGISGIFKRPDWQSAMPQQYAMRGVPDISGNASPDTGYTIFVSGHWTVVGGTSAVSPLMAGLAARMIEGGWKGSDFMPKALYAVPSSCYRDITVGSNGAYSAGSGYDLCTGLGVPDGVKLLASLSSGTVKPPPPQPPPPTGKVSVIKGMDAQGNVIFSYDVQ